MSIEIRVAVLEDLPQIVALMNAGAVGARAQLESTDLASYQRAFLEILQADEVDIYVLCELGNGHVLATCQLTLEKGLAFQGRSRASVESMHTRASHRGQGLGRALLQYVIEVARARGAVLVQLTSNATRADAHRFYLREGFEQTHLGFKLML
ncbi:GNAT family N-acetyltransferase [Polycladidibacter hongkongensis]|uniref:GNAT family N-acetyltransferase n=1 Tax=Polycladidibacter hongkongensis TaxID=1647556 RepID=UPI000830D718|nr:GNAT family N-acetyltransferase [Pseudovibrio hongkongensis]